MNSFQPVLVRFTQRYKEEESLPLNHCLLIPLLPLNSSLVSDFVQFLENLLPPSLEGVQVSEIQIISTKIQGILLQLLKMTCLFLLF